MKTIKQLADELGVSKTAVRNYMDADFRAKYTTKDDKGVITITPDGCKVIAENLAKPAETDRKGFAETELVTIPRSVLAAFERQLEEKDRQIADLTATVRSQAESINADRHTALAGTLKPMLEDGERKKSRFSFFSRKKDNP